VGAQPFEFLENRRQNHLLEQHMQYVAYFAAKNIAVAWRPRRDTGRRSVAHDQNALPAGFRRIISMPTYADGLGPGAHANDVGEPGVGVMSQGEPGRSSAWRAGLVRLGLWRGMAVLTGFSILASLVLTYLLALMLRLPAADVGAVLWIGAIVPAMVAPMATHFVLVLAVELEQTRAALALLATRDGLTQAYTRRHFIERLDAEMSRSRRGGALSVLMVDADHFKQINDAHGHAAGDTVLRGIVEACRKCLRPCDMVGRFGGEEFAVLLTGAGMQQACEVSERVRAAVAALRFISPTGAPLAVTVSIGVGTLQPDDTSAAAVLDRADAALYRAKRDGRNRWAC
jgi:diguanylate cyclase (GGDEF)-like protein